MSERHAERRVITALFVDVVGSTALGRELGPERLKRTLDRAFRDLAAIISVEGGTVEKYAGDAVHAIFGAPTAHADDPQRALRAALACARWGAEQSGESVPVAVRVGVETGEAIVDLTATGAERQQMSVGTCVNVAARLQQLAEPGQVLVGPLCRDAAAEAAEFTPLGDVELKGLGPLTIWRLVGLTGPRPGARLPFVGRDAELDLLELAYRRARTGRGVLTLVSGPPGQGKTRLVEEFLARLGTVPRLRVARCRPPGAAGAGSPLREILADDADGSAEHLAGRLVGLFHDATERDRVLAALAHSAGIAAREDLARLSIAERQDEIVSGWRRYLAALAAERPLVVWVEDVHWAEPEVVRLLDRVSAGIAAPLLVVATARPEFGDRAGIRPGGDRFFLEVDALDAPAARTLAGHAGGRDEMGIERAEGNPLFVIELARSRSLRADRSIPITLQGVIGARLDELPERDRELLQRTSIVGERLTVRDVALLTGRDAVEIVPALERLADLLYLHPVPGGYRFHHGLVRDVAYGRLSAEERMRLHARYAREGVPPDDVERVAHHLWEALEPADAGWVWEGSAEVPDLRARAHRAHLAAGRQYAARFATQSALEAFDRARQFAAGPAEAAVIEQAIGTALAADGRGDEAWVHYLQARDLYKQVGTPPPEIYADLLDLVAWTPGMFKQMPDDALVQALLAEGERLARSIGAAPALARLLGARTTRTGDARALEEGLRLLEAAADPAPFAPFLLVAASHQMRWGDWEGVARTFEQLDRLSAAGYQVDQADEHRPGHALYAGDLAIAEEMVARFAAANAARGPHLRTHAFRERAHVLLARGDWRGLVAVADEVERLIEGNPGTAFCYAVTTTRALGAVAHALLGQTAEARAFLARTETRLTTTPFWHEAVLLLICGVLGRRSETERLLREVRPQGRLPVFFRRTEATVLTMLERWDDLDEPLRAVEEAAARGSPFLAALAAAVREERAAAQGGPPPMHAALRGLGYAGWSALLQHRPAGR